MSELTKLFPKETKVKFNKLDRELTVGKITLADDSWMLNEFGGKEGLKEVFAKTDFRSMIRIIYRLLSDEDKKFLAESFELNVYDEDGEPTKIKSSVDKLTYMLGIDELDKVVKALMSARGASMPDVVKGEGDEDEKKILTLT